MTILDFQHERIFSVQQWYEEVYCLLDENTPKSVRFIVLWAVFNALYNIADYPNVALRGVSESDGKVIPHIHGHDERTKLRHISRIFSVDENFVNSIFQNHQEFITYLAQRIPGVHQPANTEIINFDYEQKSYSQDLSNLHGIASIDNRITLQNGEVLFQYQYLDLDHLKENLPTDRQKFIRQLLYMLYQIRNNIVHGGSAAFFMHESPLSLSAIRILIDFIRYLLANPEILTRDGE